MMAGKVVEALLEAMAVEALEAVVMALEGGGSRENQ